MPKGSETEGITYTAAVENARSISAPRSQPGKRNDSVMPSSSTSAFHAREHVARARHDEDGVGYVLENPGGSLHEVLRPLLEGDATEEEDDRAGGRSLFRVGLDRLAGVDAVVHDRDLVERVE